MSIIVLAEVIPDSHALRPASLNAVTAAKALQEKIGGDIIGLLVGSDCGQAADTLAKSGVTKVIVAKSEQLASYMAETFAPTIASVANGSGATHIIGTATAYGKDVLPRVAALTKSAMVSDVSAILEPKVFSRPMLAGNAIAQMTVNADKVVLSIRQTEWTAASDANAAVNIETVTADAQDALGAEVVSLDAVKSERPDLGDAKFVVSGGRGMKTGENFKHLEKLADILGGAMGATRAACDAGLVPNDLQVGQTGKVVAPDLYIAVGISGAIQHIAGMKGSKVIVAINKDPDAPIFKIADYGLVSKWEDCLEDLTAKIQAAVS